MSKTKSEKSNSPPLFMILIAIPYPIIVILGDYFLLGGFELGDEGLGVYGVDAKFLECRSDEDFILYNRHEY